MGRLIESASRLLVSYRLRL